MKIGVLADSHDSVPKIEQAVNVLNSLNVALNLHAGDYCAPFIVSHYKRLNAKLIGVLGNNDAESDKLKERFAAIGFELRGRFAKIKADDSTIGLLHGDEPELLEAIISTGGFDFVIHGHTHSTRIEKFGGTLVLNPGEICGYFIGRCTVAVLDTHRRDAEICEL